MQSIVKQAWSNPLHFNFLPLKAMFSFISVKFSLMKTLMKSHHFFDLFLSGFPVTCFKIISINLMSEITGIIVSSKSLSETCPGIPETTIFPLPYCSNALTEDSLDSVSFSSLMHFCLTFCFLLVAF